MTDAQESDTKGQDDESWRKRWSRWDPHLKTLVVVCFVLFALFVFSSGGWMLDARPSGPDWGRWARGPASL